MTSPDHRVGGFGLGVASCRWVWFVAQRVCR
jgi:hypothetical protein